MPEACKKWMCADAGLLFFRLAVGLPFLVHGWMKLSSMGGTIAFFHSLGVPAAMTWFVVLLEVIGGAAVILGIGTRWFSALLAIDMFFAIVLTGVHKGPFGGHELELVLMLVAIGLAVAGAGPCSVDHQMGKGKACAACSGGVCMVHKK